MIQTDLKKNIMKPLFQELDDKNQENFGYTPVSKPKKKSLNNLTRSYNKGKSSNFTEEELKYQKEHLSILKEKYEHPVQLNMILTLTQPYINSGRIEIHNGFTNYINDRPNRNVYLFNDDYNSVFIFNNNLTTASLRKDNTRSLYERLIRNSVGFCITSERGTMKIKAPDGYTRILPAYEVVALAAQYYPQYKNWRNETYLIVTSDKKLRSEIQRAQRN
jgi:hypothetical protein